MSFDKPTRNALAKMVGAARQILKDDITRQLQSDFRLQPDGSALALDGLTEDQRGAAIELRELLEHYATSEPGAEKTRLALAFDRLAREIGFTILNRLAALRLCEERGLVIECVRKGMASDGVQMFEMLAHGALGTRYQTYRVFVENLFDELALDLGALFDRHSPLSRVFPSERALEQVLALLNDGALAHVWREDETIGWIYQYYNDESERKQMRDESQVPRNSRELAVRNQFFTPRYVVEFLTDNTLGRIWYEMQHGETRLKDDCRYLVRRPEEAIPTRTKKDPREILMLDPAGGSGHFGLYCFDLYETIYAEAYDDPDLVLKLHADFPDRDEFLRQVPRLILEHNIHIIDIDPRACQIAALALWLRAQRSWQMLKMKPETRPRIRKVNVVCAEPMPGEKDLLEEFAAELEPKELAQLVRFVFDRMQLAGEAGSLLKIEEDLHDEIERLREKMGPLFARGDFWDNAEARVLEALKEYAEQATNGHTTRRRLFADDAAQGFAFIDLCRKKYDLVLMNPPYGEPTTKNKTYSLLAYPYTHKDLYATFYERGIMLASTPGFIGALTSRTWLQNNSFAPLREELILPNTFMISVLDLGQGVLDSAMVETCATVIEKSNIAKESIFIRLNTIQQKEEGLIDALKLEPGRVTYKVNQIEFSLIAESPIVYWLPNNLRHHFTDASKRLGNIVSVKQGLGTGDDFRFIRAWWEIPSKQIGRKNRWIWLSKGGEYSRWFFSVHLLVDWQDDGYAIRNFKDNAGRELSRYRGADQYFKAGLTYPFRSTKGFNVRVLPADCIFTIQGPSLVAETTDIWFVLAYLNSLLSRVFLESLTSGGAWQVGYLQAIPYFEPDELLISQVKMNVAEVVTTLQKAETLDEVSPYFSQAFISSANSIASLTQELRKGRSRIQDYIDYHEKQIDTAYSKVVGYSTSQLSELCAIARISQKETIDEDAKEDLEVTERTTTEWNFAYIVGCAFGRWDIRIAVDPTLAPKLQDPFDPLPVCPPGMLVGTDGLPAALNNIVSEDWLRARPNAITLPDIATLNANHIPLTTTHYPMTIAWDGILVDDPGLNGNAAHPADIARRVREALALLWGDRAQAIEDEACKILGVSDMRNYFRAPSGFFADHLKRHSKSRRQAPIYLPLSTAAGRYTVWVYYHRLTQDTLFTVVNQYVEPKIESVDKRGDQLAEKLRGASGKTATDLRDQLNETKELLSELRDFRTELLRVAQLPYKPNLNDGVIITVAPLHKLFRLRKWATDTAAVWKKLEAGEYDWAHLAYVIWPGRVEKKCESDRSIAIAHGLEHLCIVDAKKASKPKRKKQAEDEEEE